ncbi:MAG: branched-chain amino acid ABC transporter permease [Deltaproteobacteria bacterium]|nr:branched-chain amino acid ABC transporter permease [Deltaproteobacteria bacterium]
MFAQLVVNGIAMGSVYGLIGLSLVLVYKTTEVINFAQSALAMTTAFVAWALVTSRGWPFWPSAAAAVALGALMGMLVQFALLRRAKEPNLLGLVILTLGLELVLGSLVGVVAGTDTKALPSPVSDTEVFEITSTLVVSRLNVLIVVVSLATMGALAAFFRFTRTGTAMKAVSQNAEAARIMGIRVNRIHMLAWGLACGLGALSGILIAPVTLVDPNMMVAPLLKAFAAAVLGGLTSLPGAAVGGWILGVVENLVGGYISPQFKSTVAFAVIILMLCLRPSGLFGRHRRKKV